jgi:hypothetical protein
VIDAVGSVRKAHKALPERVKLRFERLARESRIGGCNH